MTSNEARSQQLAATIAVGATFPGSGTLTFLTAIKPASHKIIPSPRKSLLPHLSETQIARLPYPPDILPGARDVDTPHGSMRVYEWGPATGRKVLFVHGDATPSPLFKPIADELVVRGCRVMMFDLWGRGYTDTPADLPHDCRLYSSQIDFALASSPLAWTGEASQGVSLIGFSMGGPIVLDFFTRNQHTIRGIVLLGPAGLIRKLPKEYESPLYRTSAAVPDASMRRLIGDLLGVTVGSLKTAADVEPSSDEGFSPVSSLQFQYDYHAGHVHSFLSTILSGPLQNQEALWARAGNLIRGANLLEGQKTDVAAVDRILVICGADDIVVPPRDVEEDLLRYFSCPDYFRFETVPGGHGFPWPEGKSIAASIVDFWGLEAPAGRTKT